MNKLYTVTVSYQFVVVASNENEAKQEAIKNCLNGLHTADEEDMGVHVIAGIANQKWDDECIPVNSKHDVTIGEYRAELEHNKYVLDRLSKIGTLLRD